MDRFECRVPVGRICHNVCETIDTEEKAGTSRERQFLDKEVEDLMGGFDVLRAEKSKAGKRDGAGDRYWNRVES